MAEPRLGNLVPTHGHTGYLRALFVLLRCCVWPMAWPQGRLLCVTDMASLSFDGAALIIAHQPHKALPLSPRPPWERESYGGQSYQGCEREKVERYRQLTSRGDNR